MTQTKTPSPEPSSPPEGGPLTRPLAIAGGAVVAIGGLIGASAGAMAATGGTWSRPDTFVVLFGVISLVAGALGALVALGRFEKTVGMTLLIGAGMLLVGGALSEAQIIAGALGQGGGEFRVYHGVELKSLMLAQLSAAALGFVLCAAQVWSRNPAESLPQVLRSAIAFVLLGAIILCAVYAPIRTSLLSTPSIIKALIVVLGGVLAIVFTAAGGHTLIRSFEVADHSVRERA